MVENRGLVPLGIKDQPVLFPKQQQDLLNSARMYLRGLNVAITSDTLRSAVAVMGDATQRGLREKGRIELTAKDRLRPLTDKGLELREDLKKRAEAILNLSLRNQTIYKELVGPLALPLSLVLATQTEIANFHLRGNVSTVEQFTQQGEIKLALVDPLTQAGLNHLTDSMRKVSLDRFPSVSERAQIIRNMISSFVFRDTLSPLIPTSELRNFVQMVGTTPAIFSDQALRELIITLDLDDPGKSYLKDLFIQTTHTFSSPNPLPQRDDPKSIDMFYRRFSVDLLLLHPALEEQLIIINPDKVKPGSSNLWEGGESFGKLKVPSADMIAQALRQAEAKKVQFTANTLRQALTNLQWYNEQRIKQAREIAQAQQQLDERRRLSIEISTNPDYPLPKEAYFIRYTYQAKAREQWQAQTREGERLRGIIERSLEELTESQRYKGWLKRHYKDELPEMVPMPKRAAIGRLTDEEKSLIAKQSVLQRYLSWADDLLRLGYFWQKTQSPEVGMVGKEHNKKWLNRELNLTKQMVASMEEKPDAIAYDTDSLRYLANQLQSYFRRTRAPASPEELKGMENLWRDAYLVARENPGFFYRPNYFQKLAVESLQQRLAVLEFTQSAALQRKQLANERKQVKERRLDIIYQPQREVVAKDMLWPKDEAKSYLDEMDASAIPQINNMTLDEMAKETLDLLSVIERHVVLTDLPPQIFSKDQLRGWVSEQIKSMGSNLSSNLISPTRERMSRSIGLRTRLHRLGIWEKVIDGPFMPFLEGVSLDRNQFMRAFRRKVSIAYALTFRRRVINQSEEARQVYEQTMRRTFQASLARELSSRTNHLEKLKARDLGMELVEKMRTLNLVLEETTLA